MPRLGSARARLGSARAVSAQLALSPLGLAQPGLARLGSPRLASAHLGPARLGSLFPAPSLVSRGSTTVFFNLSGQHPPIKRIHPYVYTLRFAGMCMMVSYFWPVNGILHECCFSYEVPSVFPGRGLICESGRNLAQLYCVLLFWVGQCGLDM